MNKIIVGRKSSILGLITSCLFFVALTGCGSVTYATNTLTFNKDGSITENLVEEFDENLYSVSEWETETRSEIDAINNGNKKIELKDFAAADGKLSCQIEYDSDDSYFEFNAEPVFYGTIGQAIKAGYSLLTPVNDVDNMQPISSAELQKMTDSKIVIIGNGIDVNTYKDIRYISAGVVLGDDHRKATVSGDNTAYIVFD